LGWWLILFILFDYFSKWRLILTTLLFWLCFILRCWSIGIVIENIMLNLSFFVSVDSIFYYSSFLFFELDLFLLRSHRSFGSKGLEFRLFCFSEVFHFFSHVSNFFNKLNFSPFGRSGLFDGLLNRLIRGHEPHFVLIRAMLFFIVFFW
jgi:hypothetical protein